MLVEVEAVAVAVAEAVEVVMIVMLANGQICLAHLDFSIIIQTEFSWW